MKKKYILLSLVIPVYNEEEALNCFIEEVISTFKNNKEVIYEMLFVNDGSTDGTLQKLISYQKIYNFITIIDFSRNYGKESALSAGLNNANGDIVVPIDVDLQDPPELIIKMIDKWKQGYDVVLAQRTDRKNDSFFKRKSAEYFYNLHNILGDTKIAKNVGDFRLMDKKVVKAVNLLLEKERFMKGLFSWVGYKTFVLSYKRNKRIIGKTKFSYLKLAKLAIEGILSFTTWPLRLWTLIGIFIMFISFIFGFYIFVERIFFDNIVAGYSSLMLMIIFLGGLQLIGIGIIAEYIAKIFIEVKNRPQYLINKIYKAKKKDS